MPFDICVKNFGRIFMIEFYEYQDDNYDKLYDMMVEFYRSDAVDHPIDTKIIRRLLDDIMSKRFSVNGYEVHYSGNLVGFGVVTTYYTSEVAGINVQLEDLYICPDYRSKGIARLYFKYIMNEFKDASRFRLEVSPRNVRAEKLYRELGFEILEYNQMILDKPIK